MSNFSSLLEEITNLREAQSLLEAIFNATNDAISVVNEQGIGILINPAYTALTGLTEKDVIGKPATVEIAEGESVHLQVLKTKKAVRGVKMKVGLTKKEVIVNVAPIIVNNQLKGSVGIIRDISEIKTLSDELARAKSLLSRLEAKYNFDDIIGKSQELVTAIEQAKRAASTPATVLLRGESGTGKELFAHAIHNASPRSDQRFVRVNCAALSESLLESELFGYQAGAFTGASKGGKVGLFEEANGGTIFLDEIGEISISLQTKLLRVLQEKEIMRVGSTEPVHIDVRVISATNANLEQKIQEGSFRQDLYYRLNVVPIFVPPLRRRKRDIPLLVQHLIKNFSVDYGRRVKKISEEVFHQFRQYSWPGNVRELENVLGRAFINLRPQEEVIGLKHLPPLDIGSDDSGDEAKVDGSEDKLKQASFKLSEGTLDEILQSVEKQVIEKVLVEEKGNKTRAARRLDISHRSLYYKLERHNLR